MTGECSLIRAGDKSYHSCDTDTRAASGLMRGNWRPIYEGCCLPIIPSCINNTIPWALIQDANLPIRKHCASSISSYFEQQSLQELILFSHHRPMGGRNVGLWPIRGQDTVSGQHLASARLLLHPIASLSLIEHRKQFPVSLEHSFPPDSSLDSSLMSRPVSSQSDALLVTW